MRFTIVCEVARGRSRRRGVIRGRDVYGLTAASVVRGALTPPGAESPASGGARALPGVRARGTSSGSSRRFDVEWEVESQPRETARGRAA